MKTLEATAMLCFLLASGAGCGDSSTDGSDTSTGSAGQGGSAACTTDVSEPHSTIADPAFVNDASTGLALCDHTGITVKGGLDGSKDIDAFRGYTDMSKPGCTPQPTVVFTSNEAASVCFYLQDDAAPTVKSCPGNATKQPLGGYTGCCVTTTAGSATTLTLTDIQDLFKASSNTQFAIVASSANGAACAPYTLNVHF